MACYRKESDIFKFTEEKMKGKIAFIAVTLIIILIVSIFMIRIVDATVQIDDEYIDAQEEVIR